MYSMLKNKLFCNIIKCQDTIAILTVFERLLLKSYCFALRRSNENAILSCLIARTGCLMALLMFNVLFLRVCVEINSSKWFSDTQREKGQQKGKSLI